MQWQMEPRLPEFLEKKDSLARKTQIFGKFVTGNFHSFDFSSRNVRLKSIPRRSIDVLGVGMPRQGTRHGLHMPETRFLCDSETLEVKNGQFGPCCVGTRIRITLCTSETTWPALKCEVSIQEQGCAGTRLASHDTPRGPHGPNWTIDDIHSRSPLRALVRWNSVIYSLNKMVAIVAPANEHTAHQKAIHIPHTDSFSRGAGADPGFF